VTVLIVAVLIVATHTTVWTVATPKQPTSGGRAPRVARGISH